MATLGLVSAGTGPHSGSANRRWGLEKLVGGGLQIEGLSRDARLSGAHLNCMATFALGGTAGLKQAEAARALNLPEMEVRRRWNA